jgi:DDE superfamily endonuclease
MLRFFKQIDAAVSRDQDVHVILDNLSAHCTPAIAKWLAHKDRRRWNMHLTPTSSSWLNLIERWFQGTHHKRLRCGAFSSAADLTAAITTGSSIGTAIPSPSYGRPPPTTSSPKSNVDATPSARSSRRRTTRPSGRAPQASPELVACNMFHRRPVSVGRPARLPGGRRLEDCFFAWCALQRRGSQLFDGRRLAVRIGVHPGAGDEDIGACA